MRRSLCLMLLVLVSGCGAQDPYNRPNTWTATGSNDANLRIMVANPNDLRVGVDSPGALGAEAAPAISRLLSGQRTPLPNTSASTVGAANQPAGQLPPPPAGIQ